MLGKLFGYLAIIKSGKILSSDQAEFITTSLLALHGYKAWMREIVSEAFLVLIHSINDNNILTNVLSKIGKLLEGPVEEFAGWQIVLWTGLELFTQSKSASDQALLAPLLPHQSTSLFVKSPVTTFENLKLTLLAATSGYPKVSDFYYITSYN